MSSLSEKQTRLLGLYEEESALRFGERTLASYLSHLKAALGWLSARGCGLHDIMTKDLLAYQSALLAMRKKDGKPYSIGHHINRLSALKSFFRFLFRRGHLLMDPAASLEFPRKEKRLPRLVLRPQEVLRILEAAKEKNPMGLRDRAILETLYATGIRASELADLTPYDVDTEERTLRVVLGKGGKDRHLPLTHAAAGAIEAYLMKGRSYLASPGHAAMGRPIVKKGGSARVLFLSDQGGVIQRAVLGRIVKKYVRKAGIKKHVTAHTFRHSVATHLLLRRADIRHIQALLGHRSLSTTERYTHLAMTDLRKVIARAHPRGR